MGKTVMFILAISVLGGIYHFIKPDPLPDGDASNLKLKDSNSSDEEVVDGYAIERRKRDEEDKEEDIARLNDLIDEIQEKRAKHKSKEGWQFERADVPVDKALPLCFKIYNEDEKKLAECEYRVLYD